MQAAAALVDARREDAGRRLQHRFGRRLPALAEALAPLPVIGVIEPGAEAALAAAPDGPIAIIATEGTVKGGAYVRAIHAHGSNVPVAQQACPLFVPMAEEGLIDGDDRRSIAHRYLDPLLATCRSRNAWCSAARTFRR